MLLSSLYCWAHQDIFQHGGLPWSPVTLGLYLLPHALGPTAWHWCSPMTHYPTQDLAPVSTFGFFSHIRKTCKDTLQNMFVTLLSVKFI